MDNSNEYLRRQIKNALHEAFKRETPQTWEPLYEFLQAIFGERYLDAADGFMFMGGEEVEDGPFLYLYKHGITRKYLALDKEGNPYSNQATGAERIDNQEAYDNVYKDIYNYASMGGNIDPELSKEPWFVKYVEFKKNRDKTLKDAGYDVLTIEKPEDIDQHRDKLELDELSIASLVGMSKDQRGNRIKKAAAEYELSKAIFATLFSEANGNYKQAAMEALDRFKAQVPNFASLFPNMFRKDQGVAITMLDMPDGRSAKGVIPEEFYFFANPLTGVFDKKGGRSFLEDMLKNF